MILTATVVVLCLFGSGVLLGHSIGFYRGQVAAAESFLEGCESE